MGNMHEITVKFGYKVLDFSARNKTPLVFGVLLKPVSPENSAFIKPTLLSKARKSIPGMVPPSH